MNGQEFATHIDISGLRGFATNQRLELAIPNGKVGSGLTIVVGQNNAGKSTVTEAFAAIAGHPSILRHFSEGSLMGSRLKNQERPCNMLYILNL
jgi:AAA15 family ATPase/GTPase